jgi:hypothetical protein
MVSVHLVTVLHFLVAFLTLLTLCTNSECIAFHFDFDTW